MLEQTSRKLGKSVNINVVLPKCECPENGFRVIYLLHGWSEDHTAWMRNTSIERYALKRDLAVIMPDGGFSFYNNMADGMRWSKEMEKFFLAIPGNPFCYHFVTYPGIHTWDSWDAHIEEALDYQGLTLVR